jgi:hypothetical protein
MQARKSKSSLNRDRLERVESSPTRTDDASRDLRVESDLLDVLLMVLEQQLGRDVDRFALALHRRLVLVRLDGEVPEGDGALGGGGGKDGGFGGVPGDGGNGGGVPGEGGDGGGFGFLVGRAGLGRKVKGGRRQKQEKRKGLSVPV